MSRSILSFLRPHRAAVLAAAAVGLAACSSMPPDEGLTDNPPFAAGWQQHTSPLYHRGPGPTAGTTVWQVSGLLPQGHYLVISRQGDRARLIEGHRFEVDGSVNKEIRLILPMTSGNVEALDERYLLPPASAR
jgi:hypothetical protein